MKHIGIKKVTKVEKDSKEVSRIAVIGVGMIGRVHVERTKDAKGCNLVAICDKNPKIAELAKEMGVKYYDDHKKMIESEDLDGVIIALANELHEPVGSYCAGKGLHIMMEKPIAPDTASAKKLIKSAKANNVKLLIAHHRRFNAKINTIKNMIADGELGRLVGVSILWSMYKPSQYFVEGPWRKVKGSGGPILINTIHEIDNLRYIYGEIAKVYGEVSNKIRGFEVEDTVSVTIRFHDGTLASILMSDAAPSLWGYECTMRENPFFFPTYGRIYTYLGTEASLTVPAMNKTFYPDPDRKGWQYPLETEEIKVKYRDPYVDQISHFCRVIRGQEQPRTSGEDGLKTLEITMAVMESGISGKPIDINFDY